MAHVHDLKTQSIHTNRQHWMSVLARASLAELTSLTSDIDMPQVEIVKPAEIGTLMVEGRAGGGGRRFNAGEATLTRCVVRDGARLGFAYALGRDKAKALLCARLDALLQDDAQRDALMAKVVNPLADAQQRRKDDASRRAAATKVEFFTMVRGDG
jgi:alpha-D-ribose 1-methylphosphonate 5-triphosphate synthase subunit PhnG